MRFREKKSYNSERSQLIVLVQGSRNNTSSFIFIERLNTWRSPQYSIGIAKMSGGAINLRMPIRGYGRRIRNRPARRANLLCGCRRITRPPLAQVIILERSLMRLGEPGGLQQPEIVPPWPPRSSPAREPPSARKPCAQPHSLSRGRRGERAILPRPRHMRCRMPSHAHRHMILTRQRNF